MNKSDRDKRLAELQSRLAINRDDLDRELVEQPSLFADAGEGFAYASSHRDFLKNKLKDTMAAAQERVRSLAAKGPERVTEAKVAALVDADEEVAAIRNSIIKASRDVDIWDALKEAFRQRSFILRSVCDLHIAGLTAQVSVGSTAARADEARHMDRRKRMREGTND